MVFKIWNTCDYFARPSFGMDVSPVDVKSVAEICDVYGATLEEFEKVLEIERTVFPRLQEQVKSEFEGEVPKAPVRRKPLGRRRR